MLTRLAGDRFKSLTSASRSQEFSQKPPELLFVEADIACAMVLLVLDLLSVNARMNRRPLRTDLKDSLNNPTDLPKGRTRERLREPRLDQVLPDGP